MRKITGLAIAAILLCVSVAFAMETQTDIRILPAQKAVKSDTKPPTITITSPAVKRGLKIKAKETAVTIAGRAIDESGVAEVTVNGQAANLDENGNFSAEALLKVGDNAIVVTAVDTKKNTAEERFTILREAGKVAVTAAKPTSYEEGASPLVAGRYYALVIGNNNYQHLTKLKTAVSDAEAVSRELKQSYGFETKILLNAKRKDILSTLNDYRKKLNEQDNFLIYYAGHGEYDKSANKAYWLPVDAQRDDPTEWIIADDITSNIKRLTARHVLIVSDSCYSGTLDRSIETDITKTGGRDEFVKKMLVRSSRTLMASGGNEPVSDSGGSGHSIFADSLLKALRGIEHSAFTADELFYQHVRSRVAGKSDQVPEYKEIRNSGHEGGDFIFMKKK